MSTIETTELLPRQRMSSSHGQANLQTLPVAPTARKSTCCYSRAGSFPFAGVDAYTICMENWNLARNFRFAGVHCGIRPNADPGRLDLALIVSDTPACAAGVFTQNRVVRRPGAVCAGKGCLRPRHAAIVICSGNANACTGEQGMRDARRMTECAGDSLGFGPSGQMLVAPPASSAGCCRCRSSNRESPTPQATSPLGPRLLNWPPGPS